MPRKYKRTPVSEKVALLFDKQLLHLLENGRPLLDSDGNAVLDADGGGPVVKPLTAADLQVIRNRLRDLGLTNVSPESLSEQEGMARTLERIRRQACDEDSPMLQPDAQSWPN